MFSRIFRLFKSRQSKNSDTSNNGQDSGGFFNGRKYINDVVKIPIQFQICFLSFAKIKEIKIMANGVDVSLKQAKDSLNVFFILKISEKLFNDLYSNIGQQWILGYIGEILPFVNEEILRQKYKYAYYLLRTFTIFDASEIRLVDSKSKRGLIINGPFGMDSIPIDSWKPISGDDHLYFRDFVDAVSSYFYANYEDCVRRLITSVENFIKHHNLKRLKKDSKSKFIDTINQNVDIFCDLHDHFIAKDIVNTYLLRNQIVHDGKRLNPINDKQKIKWGIHSILMLYKIFGDDEKPKNFASYLDLQFVSFEGFLGQVVTLNSLEKQMKNKRSK